MSKTERCGKAGQKAKTIFPLFIAFFFPLFFPLNVFPQNAFQNEESLSDSSGNQKSASQNNLTVVVSEHNFDLNPHTSAYSAEAQILTGLYEGLFSYNPVTLNPEYAAAKEYRIARDNRRWTFILRDGLKFSDGRKITSEEIRNSWLRLLKNENAPFSSFFDIIKGAEEFRTGKGSAEDVGIYAASENTVSVHLKNPASHLPKILCMPSFSIVPEEENVFSGPFTLEEKKEGMIILSKNENYWDKNNTPLERISFLVSSNLEENSYLFNTGLADWISGSADLSKIIRKNVTQLNAQFATEYIFFKNRNAEDGRESLFSRKEIRAALLEAVPWDKLREDVFVKATSLVYPLASYPQVQGYVYTDSKEAENLIEEFRKENGIPPDEKIKIRFAVTESEYLKKQAEILKEAWIPLGVELETVEIPSGEYLESISRTDADLFSYTWIGDFADPLAFLELFRSDSTLNVTGWKNQEFDRLLNEASLHTDENHSKLLSRAEQILLDDAEIIPVQHPVSFNIIDLNSVGGWASNAFDIHPLKYLFRRETKPDIPNIVMSSTCK